MDAHNSPDVVVNICTNCIPNGERLPRQWARGGVRVLVREVPCTGKIDAQYLFHLLESGGMGLRIIACPKGECKLAEGNFRAEMRVRTVERLLAELGLEPERLDIIHVSANDSAEQIKQLILDAADKLCSMGASELASNKTSGGLRE